MYQTTNIFVTGGAGCLGRAIARKRKEEGWTGKLTVYSRDTFKHERMRKLYPDVNFVQGDILNPELLYNAMVGHDIVIHAAACKVIPTSEYQSIDTFVVNVEGSMNVCAQAVRANIQHVLGISTDKSCHPANAYGASKMMMEKVFQEYSRMPTDTEFHLVRYGNVLESTGSVVEAWRKAVEGGEAVKVTLPEMTRFWLSPRQAADYAMEAIGKANCIILVPVMPALSIGKLLEYVVGENYHNIAYIPLRPGEKIHETLVTAEECSRSRKADDFIYVFSSTDKVHEPDMEQAFTSNTACELTEAELLKLLED